MAQTRGALLPDDPSASEPVVASAMPPGVAPAAARTTDVPVRFLRSYRAYQRGDIAGFAESYVAELVRRGVAIRITAPPLSAAPGPMVRKT